MLEMTKTTERPRVIVGAMEAGVEAVGPNEDCGVDKATGCEVGAEDACGVDKATGCVVGAEAAIGDPDDCGDSDGGIVATGV